MRSLILTVLLIDILLVGAYALFDYVFLPINETTTAVFYTCLVCATMILSTKWLYDAVSSEE